MNFVQHTNPKISVVILSYNFEKYLRESIESVMAQTLAPFEVIVSDDHSTDGSWDIISEYGRLYPGFVKTFRQERNLGAARNSNSATDKAVGDLVSMMDGDDRWLPRKLELEWNALKEHPEAAIAYSKIRTIDETGKPAALWPSEDLLPLPNGDKAESAAIFFESYLKNLCRYGLLHRSVMDDLHGVDVDVKIFNDWDFMIRAAARYGFAYSGETLVEYRYHDEGVHNRPIEEIFSDLLVVYTKNFPYDALKQHYRPGRIQQCVEAKIVGFVHELKQACDERLRLIHQLTATAEERLAQIETLTKTAEERLRMIQLLDADVKRSANQS